MTRLWKPPRWIDDPALLESMPISEVVAEFIAGHDFLLAVLPLFPLLAAKAAITPEAVFRRCGALDGAVVIETVGWLPKNEFAIPGSLHVESRRCGVPDCHCADGIALHGPYTFHHWREGGRQRRKYIPVRHVGWVRAAVDRWASVHPDGRRGLSSALRYQRVAARWLNREQRNAQTCIAKPRYPYGHRRPALFPWGATGTVRNPGSQ